MFHTIRLTVMGLMIAAAATSARGDLFGQALRANSAGTQSVVRLPQSPGPSLGRRAGAGMPGKLVLTGYNANDGYSISDDDAYQDGDSCDTCDTPSSCCPKPRIITFGEVLYLHPGDTDFTYALPRNGLAPNGAVGTADPDFNLGFRVGVGWSPDGLQSIIGSFTWFESSTIDQLTVNPGNNVGPLTIHPNTASAASVFLRATATYDIDFQMADVAYRAIIGRSPQAQVAYSVGLRYAKLQENASVLHDLSAFTPTTVTTDMDFEGFGIRLGLDGRRVFPSGLMLYGKGAASFIAGEYDGTYSQVNALNQVEAFSDIEDDRIVTILEYELGVGWVSAQERIEFRVGYYFAAWQNAMPTNSYIQAVQASNFVDVSDTITFNGLVSRVTLRF